MDIVTWTPFQSEETKQIYAHMTDDEKKRGMIRGCCFGLWVGLFLTPLANEYIIRNLNISTTTAIVFIILNIIFIPSWFKSQKRFLCSTKWAKSQGYNSDQIALYKFRK